MIGPMVLVGAREVQRNLTRFGLALSFAPNRAAKSVAIAIRNDARKFAPTDLKILRNNIVVEKTDEGYEVVSNADYGGYVEYGTRPHFVSPAALAGWADRRLGDQQLAFPVAQKIAEKGTPAQPYMRPAYERNRDLLPALVKTELVKTLDSL